MTTEGDPFTAAAATDPAIALTVELSDACECGSTVALSTAGVAVHRASLHCASCGAHRGWLSRKAYSFVGRIIAEFGPLTAPIKIRRGERTVENSGAATPNTRRPYAGNPYNTR
jgi:hypothetical protein